MNDFGADPGDYQSAIERADSKQADASRARRHGLQLVREPQRRLLPRVLALLAVTVAILWAVRAFEIL
jgi:hypothetical protein